MPWSLPRVVRLRGSPLLLAGWILLTGTADAAAAPKNAAADRVVQLEKKAARAAEEVIVARQRLAQLELEALRAAEEHSRARAAAASVVDDAASGGGDTLEEHDITFFTMGSSEHWLPFELMLPHQVAESSSQGRSALKRIVALKVPPSPFHDFPEHGIDITDAEMEEAGAEIVQLDLAGLNDTKLFSKFFSGERSASRAKTLRDLWASGFKASASAEDHRAVYHASTNSLAMLSVFNLCETTYCAFLDPNVLVHRHPGEVGWIDRAVTLLKEQPRLALVQAAHFKASQKHGCSSMASRDGTFSQRYYVAHRQRLQKFLPVHVSCAPRCDHFEDFFRLPREHVGMVTCSPTAAWVIHAPEGDDELLELLESCGGGGAYYPVTKEHEQNYRKKLAPAIRVGLPGLQRHIATGNFGHAATVAGGEGIAESLQGWKCARDEL